MTSSAELPWRHGTDCFCSKDVVLALGEACSSPPVHPRRISDSTGRNHAAHSTGSLVPRCCRCLQCDPTQLIHWMAVPPARVPKQVVAPQPVAPPKPVPPPKPVQAPAGVAERQIADPADYAEKEAEKEAAAGVLPTYECLGRAVTCPTCVAHQVESQADAENEGMLTTRRTLTQFLVQINAANRQSPIGATTYGKCMLAGPPTRTRVLLGLSSLVPRGVAAWSPSGTLRLLVPRRSSAVQLRTTATRQPGPVLQGDVPSQCPSLTVPLTVLPPPSPAPSHSAAPISAAPSQCCQCCPLS